MTVRTDIEGTCARWFAVDAIRQIAVFTGAYAAWPAAVFSDYSIVDAADELLSAAPSLTVGVPSVRERERARTRPSPLSWDSPPNLALLEASQGLFSFDADLGYGGSTIYYLDASPHVPLLLADAHPTIQRAARLVAFPHIRFSAEQIDLGLHVPFVVGNG